MLNAKNTIKTAGFMILATLLAKFAGMGRDILFASLYGTGQEATAYLTASRIPLLFFDITLGAAISASFIPIFNEYIENKQEDAACRYANNFITVIFLITSILCALGIIFSRQLVGIIGNGLADAEKHLAAQLVVILFPSMIFTALAYALTGVLQSRGEFNIPAAISLVSNAIMLLYLFFVGDRFGIHGVVYAMLIAWAFQVLIQIPALRKHHFAYKPVLNLKNADMKRTLLLAMPILVSSWVQPINTSINIYLASFLNEGQAVAALDYANKLYIIFVGVLTYAVSNLIFPTISRLAAGNHKQELGETITKATKIILAILLPIMVLFLLLRVPVIRFVYERGKFTSESTTLTASALLFYSLGMLGFGVSEILNKAFYALKDGKTPMYVAMAGIALNIALSFFFVRWLHTGLWGLAFAASIAANLIGLVLLIILDRRLHLIKFNFFSNILKLFLASIIMGIIVYIVLHVLSFNDDFLGRLLTLLIPSTVGILTYCSLLFLFRTDEAKELLSLIKQRR